MCHFRLRSKSLMTKSFLTEWWSRRIIRLIFGLALGDVLAVGAFEAQMTRHLFHVLKRISVVVAPLQSPVLRFGKFQFLASHSQQRSISGKIIAGMPGRFPRPHGANLFTALCFHGTEPESKQSPPQTRRNSTWLVVSNFDEPFLLSDQPV